MLMAMGFFDRFVVIANVCETQKNVCKVLAMTKIYANGVPNLVDNEAINRIPKCEN